MCRVLDKLKGKEAEELLAEYAVDDSVPVNLNQILLNIRFIRTSKEFCGFGKIIGEEKGRYTWTDHCERRKSCHFF